MGSFKGDGVFCNARMNNRMIKRFCEVEGPAESFLASAMENFALSETTIFGIAHPAV